MIVVSRHRRWVKYTFSQTKLSAFGNNKAVIVFRETQLKRLPLTPRGVKRRPFIVSSTCMNSFFVAAEIAVSWGRLRFGSGLNHTWCTCVYLHARAVNTKWLNKVADAVRRLKIHAWPQTIWLAAGARHKRAIIRCKWKKKQRFHNSGMQTLHSSDMMLGNSVLCYKLNKSIVYGSAYFCQGLSAFLFCT